MLFPLKMMAKKFVRKPTFAVCPETSQNVSGQKRVDRTTEYDAFSSQNGLNYDLSILSGNYRTPITGLVCPETPFRGSGHRTNGISGQQNDHG